MCTTSTETPINIHPTDAGNWQSPLVGHGMAYFRELEIDYKTLQWINPFSVESAELDKVAAERQKVAEDATKLLAEAKDADRATREQMKQSATIAADEAAHAAGLLRAKKNAAEQACKEARALADKLIENVQACKGVWSHILEFESVLIRLFPKEKLKAKYGTLATEYTELTGKTAPAVATTEPELRAQAERLLEEVHWIYATAPLHHKVRGSMLISMLWVFAILASVSLLLSDRLGALSYIAIAGGLGAALSAFQRIQSRGIKGDALTNIARMDSDRWVSKKFWRKVGNRMSAHGSFAAAPVIGALCALVLTFAFLSNLINGAMFPNLDLKSGPPLVETFRGLSSATKGSLLIWAFIAGFSERLVPDIISRLTDQGSKPST